MWWQVVFQLTCLLFVGGMHVMPDPLAGDSTGIHCMDYTNERFAKMMREGVRTRKPLFRKMMKRSVPDRPTEFSLNMQPMLKSRRMDTFTIIDNLIPRGDYLVKEHAKLVHDINSLRQVVFITPIVDEHKDYDDSIFHEIIETSTTLKPEETTRPYAVTTRQSSTSTKGSSIPIILLGGASQRQVVKSQPINFAKPTVSLVGTTISPVVKHPYPFVMHRKPVKICVTSLPPMPATQPSKTLWERLIDYFLPRRSLGR